MSRACGSCAAVRDVAGAVTGRVGSALPCDCGHDREAHTGPAGECDGPGYDGPVNAGCPCDGYGITMEAP